MPAAGAVQTERERFVIFWDKNKYNYEFPLPEIAWQIWQAALHTARQEVPVVCTENKEYSPEEWDQVMAWRKTLTASPPQEKQADDYGPARSGHDRRVTRESGSCLYGPLDRRTATRDRRKGHG